MAARNAQQVAQKWARNLGNASQDILSGIDRVTTAPTQLAAQKKTAMKARLNAAIDSGKWERGLARVDLNAWKTAFKNKGVPRVSQGAQDAEPKMAAFMSQWLPVADGISQQIKAMPKITLADSKARAAAAIDAAYQFGQSRK